MHATRSLQGPDDEVVSAYTKREVDNGVGTNDLIEAVIWSNHPLIKAAISAIEDRTDDPKIQKLIQDFRNPANLPGPDKPTS